MSAPHPGHEYAKTLDVLIREWPDLQIVMKALQADYVFVRRYLRTIPKTTDGRDYRTDAYVNGLYVVDTRAVRAHRYPQIDQDYLVQWRDGRTPEVSYYSGIPKQFRKIRPDIWHDIARFCAEFGHRGQYGCPEQLNHSYRDASDPSLPREEPWPKDFNDAVARAFGHAAVTSGPHQ